MWPTVTANQFADGVRNVRIHLWRNDMTQPRLSAEASIYKTSGLYRYSWRPSSAGRIIPSQGDSLPGGTYQNSCYGCYIDYVEDGIYEIAVLYCTCIDKDGNPQSTALTYESVVCSNQDIRNCDGQLACIDCGLLPPRGLGD
jgi:hypothetical protein